MSSVAKAPAVNFIRHIDLFFEIAKMSPAINYGHIALYISLFRSWNHAFFNNPMSPTREEVMVCAGIKSKECYYRILRELSALDLIRYYPSKSKYETGLFCVSSLEWVEHAITVTVWSVSHHQTICGKQMEIPLTESKNFSPGQSKPHKLQLINGRGVLFPEKKVVLDFNSTQSASGDTAFNPLSDSRYVSPIDTSISSSSKNNYHANAQNSQSRHSSLRPPGIPLDPNADYSIPL